MGENLEGRPLKFGKGGLERPRYAAECSENTRHCGDAVALPTLVAGDLSPSKSLEKRSESN